MKNISKSFIIISHNDIQNALKLISQIKSQFLQNSQIILVESKKSNRNIPNIIHIKSEKGRAQQLNAGAKIAKGDSLIFLHSDSDISQINFNSIDIKEDNYWAHFKLNFDSNKKFFRFIELSSKVRDKLIKIPFGDQGLIISKKLFFRVGGFPLGGFEDFDISLKLKKITPPVIFNQNIITSPRRFLKHGPVKTFFIFSLIFFLYLAKAKTQAKKLYKLIE